jgi:glycosyltransferase involved in cell wall biosynthesis
MDFYCLGSDEGVLAPDVKALGSRVFVGNLKRNPLRFSRHFSRILRSDGYDVVHSHVHHFSGYVLRLAHRNGVRGRIAQSLTAPTEQRPSLLRRIYLAQMRRLIERHATLGLGVSSEAMVSMFGPGWRTRDDRQILYWGVDLERFRNPPTANLRERFSIPASESIVGHVGRLDRAKNHELMLDIAEELDRSGARVWLVFVGDGPLRRELQESVLRRGLKRVVFAGEVEEVASLLRAMDLFLFPSRWEGLPQSVIEAQAAGLRCLCSDVITSEVAVLPDAVRFLSLERPASDWAQTLRSMLAQTPLDKHGALTRVAESPFAIEESVRRLTVIYQDAARE